MADDILGNLSVQITGDYSDLQSSIDQAQSAAETGAEKISSAFTQVGGQMGLFGEQASSALASVNEQLSLFDVNGIEAVDSAFGSLAVSAGDSVSPVTQSSDAIKQVGESSGEAEGSLKDLAEQFTLLGESLAITEGLKEFGQEALTAYGTVQQVTIGLTALTGSATEAADVVEHIKEIAATEPFAFPEIAPTVQKMVALGVAADQIPGAMQAIADAAAATGNSFSAVANSFDRMALSGQAGTRQLVQLGVSTQDLANVMGITAEQVKNVFKALDESDRITVLEEALSKFAGTAEAEAQGISGQWQIFKNQFEEAMVGVGQALAPVTSDILSFGKSAISAIQGAVEVFSALPKPVQDVAVALGVAAAAVVPLTGALAALGLAAAGLEAIPGIFAGITAALAAEGAAAETTAAELGAATTAITGAGAAAGTTATALGTLGSALSVVGALFAGFAWGNFAGGAKDTAQQLQDMTTYAHSLGVSLSFLTSATGDATQAIKQAQNAAANAGVDFANLRQQFDSGKISAEQYVLELLQSVQAHQKAAQGADANADAHKRLQAAIASVTAATQAWDIQIETVPTKEQTIAAGIEAINAKILVQTSSLQNAIDVWAKLATDSTASSTAVADALKAVDSAAKSLGVSHQDLADKMTVAKAAAADLDVVMVNGQATMVKFKESADDAANSENDLGSATDDLQIKTDQLFTTIQDSDGTLETFINSTQNLGAVSSDTSDKVQILYGATGQLDDGYKALASDAPGVVIGMQQIADAASQAASQIDSASSALTDFSASAADAVQESLGGGGGGKGGSSSAESVLSQYVAAGASGGQLDQIAQALGLIPVGINSYETLSAYNETLKNTATAGDKNAPYEQLVANVGGGFTIQWDNLKASVSSSTTATQTHTAATQTLTQATSAASIATTTAATSLSGSSPSSLTSSLSTVSNALSGASSTSIVGSTQGASAALTGLTTATGNTAQQASSTSNSLGTLSNASDGMTSTVLDTTTALQDMQAALSAASSAAVSVANGSSKAIPASTSGSPQYPNPAWVTNPNATPPSSGYTWDASSGQWTWTGGIALTGNPEAKPTVPTSTTSGTQNAQPPDPNWIFNPNATPPSTGYKWDPSGNGGKGVWMWAGGETTGPNFGPTQSPSQPLSLEEQMVQSAITSAGGTFVGFDPDFAFNDKVNYTSPSQQVSTAINQALAKIFDQFAPSITPGGVTQGAQYTPAGLPGGGTAGLTVNVNMAGANFSGPNVANDVANALTNQLRTTLGQLRLI